MKRAVLIIICLFFISSVKISRAEAAILDLATFTYQPTPANLYNLDHYKAYIWGIDFSNLSDNPIVSATLSFIGDGLNNWNNYEDDQLFIGLLEDAPVGLTVLTDNQMTGNGALRYANATGVEYWHLDTYHDDYDPIDGPEPYSITFGADDLYKLNSFINDNSIAAIGFDPDCHYWNNGVELTVHTAPIPEPATLLLFGSSLVGLAFRRKSFNKKI